MWETHNPEGNRINFKKNITQKQEKQRQNK